jgi:NADH-quinone oxidoreductase subunit K
MFLVTPAIVLSTCLFVTGLIGLLTRRNLLLVVLSLQLMFGAGVLAFVAFDQAWLMTDVTRPRTGAVFGLVASLVAAGQLALGLALVFVLARARRSLDIEALDELKW